MPVFAGEVQLGWSEFDVVETALAMRPARLAVVAAGKIPHEVRLRPVGTLR